MERAQIFVIAAIVAALGLVGARLWLAQTSDDDDADAERSVLSSAVSNRDIARSTGAEPAPGVPAARLPGHRAPGDSEGNAQRNAAASGDRHGSQSLTVVRGTSGEPGSNPSTGGSHGTASGTGTSAAGADLSAAGHSGGTNPPPPGQPKAAEINPPSDQPNDAQDGLLLSVSNAQDMDRANVNSDVEADGDGLKFKDDSQLVYDDGTVHGDAGTIAFSLNPQWNGGDATDNSLVQVRNEDVWNNRLQIVKNGSYLRFILADDTGQESDISYRIDDWEPGQEHRIAATWGESQTALYVDGRLVGQSSYSGQFSGQAPLHIGSDFEGGDYASAGGTIKDFKVYGKALPASQLR